MVGVPGRSKGCNTCRRRKIRCDAQKPHCQRCTSTGRKCEGYAKYPTFMIWTQDGYQPRSRLDDMKPSSRSSPSSRDSSDDGNTALEKSNVCEWTHACPPSTAVCSDQIGAKFLELICASSSFYKTDPGTVWVMEALTTDHKSTSLRLIVGALVAVRVGWAEQDEALRNHGSALYGQALQSLQQALYDSKLASDEHTFVAARAMVMYEHFMSTSTSPQAWASHVSGMMLILKNRGPLPFRTLCGRAAMEDVRDTMMIKAYMDRKRVFLLEPQWMTMPWAGVGKDYRQQVCDSGLQLGALLQDFDDVLKEEPNDSIELLANILRRGLWCFGALQSLELESKNAKPGQTEISFSSAQSSVATLHYWALHISYRQLFDPLIKRLVGCEAAELPSKVTVNIQTVLDKLSDDVCLEVCRRIMDAARFLACEEMSYAGARRLPFPLLSAIYHLKTVGSPELATVSALYERFKTDNSVNITSQLGTGVSRRFDELNPRGPTGIATA